ncbi:MAG: sulfite exporter TauE/SafE family protein [Desulfarculus sp.]|jgi:uncharacterized membrane protein YfcA|nr:MAG: sulfite exporter TauE/SafE family protein [Desulfarculus sp.]
MHGLLSELFINLDLYSALQVVILGFIGGVLSGFIGSGGAFFMTPGMMNLGVQGVVAVASNITHKFGKAMVGSHKHGEMGNVDKKLALSLLITAAAGIRLAVWLSSLLFESGDASGGHKGAGANLYISLVFVSILTVVAVSMLKDVFGKKSDGDTGPSHKIAEALARLNLKPLIYFKVADVHVSLWVLLLVGLTTGYLAGTIGVGGFIGVPAMIYVFGIPTAVAAGTELYLAMFMGAFGALNYAFAGYVDLRLVLLLFLGSLLGVHLGVYGVKVVKEKIIRLVTGVIILLCVLSRAVAIPVYLRQMDLINTAASWDGWLNSASKGLLFASGFAGIGIIMYNVLKAYRQRLRLKRTIAYSQKPTGQH